MRRQSSRADTDLDRLRNAHPLWAFGTVWATRASGLDARRLVATREGIQVHAWTEAELSAKMTAEGKAHGWPGWPQTTLRRLAPPSWGADGCQ